MQSARLLLADEHPLVLEGLRTVFAAERPQWEICAFAGNGLEAVAQAVAHRPDAVVMDYQLPRLNGLEAAAEIRKRAPGVEVLLCGGTDSPYILRNLFHSRARGCLLRHESRAQLIPALEVILQHHCFRSRALTERYEQLEADRGNPIPLTRRENEILPLITQGGLTSKEAASALGVSLKTIENHRSNMFRKLGVRSVAELTRYAFLHGLVDLHAVVSKAA